MEVKVLKFEKYDMLKSRLFEQLIPDLLYNREEEAHDIFLEALENSEENIVYDLFCKLCEKDGVECLYKEEAFTINRFEEGGIRFIEISVPESSPQINYALRVYVLSAREKENPEVNHIRYFLVKKFREKEMVYVMYIAPDNEVMLGDDLTNHIEDREYEHRAVGRNFILVLLNEIHLEETDIV